MLRLKLVNIYLPHLKLTKVWDAATPLLFTVVLEIAIRKSKVQTWGTIFHSWSQIMAYADDVVIMGRTLQDIKVFTSLVQQNK